jgi:RimJ/RimL family protein N-acetyltransferase
VKRLRSLGYQTDVFLAGVSGEVVERDRYVVIRTPKNPDSRWGNFLLYREAPTEDAAAPDGEGSWLADREKELPYAVSTLLAWDRPDGARGAAEAFVAQGFEIDESSILTAAPGQITKPPRWNDDIRVEPLVTDAQWAAAVRAQTNAFSARRRGTLEDLERFMERQHSIFRGMQDAGIGQWWGAWASAELAGSLGLVRVTGGAGPKGELGRFQLVAVDPRFAGQGVCSRMVHDIARKALDEDGLSALVMAADATYHAARVYESVGFRRTEHLVAVVRAAQKS